MTQPVKKSDQHVVQQTIPGVAGTANPYGPNVFLVVNPNTGEVVERCGSFGDALAAQTKWNQIAGKIGV